MTKRVFVYGTLKEQYNGVYFFGDKKPTQALTVDKFVVGERPFPSAVRFGSDLLNDKPFITKGYQLVGEVYEVDDDDTKTISRLDRYEGYPSFYDRINVKVITEDGEVDVMMYEAKGASSMITEENLLQPQNEHSEFLEWKRG